MPETDRKDELLQLFWRQLEDEHGAMRAMIILRMITKYGAGEMTCNNADDFMHDINTKLNATYSNLR